MGLDALLLCLVVDGGVVVFLVVGSAVRQTLGRVVLLQVRPGVALALVVEAFVYFGAVLGLVVDGLEFLGMRDSLHALLLQIGDFFALLEVPLGQVIHFDTLVIGGRVQHGQESVRAQSRDQFVLLVQLVYMEVLHEFAVLLTANHLDHLV